MFDNLRRWYQEWENRQLDSIVRKLRGEKPLNIKKLLANPEFQLSIERANNALLAHKRVNDLEDTARVLESRLRSAQDWGRPVIAHRDLHGTVIIPMGKG